MIEKVGEKSDDFVNAMATIFPYEEFPLIGQMNDPIESYYKKSVIFSSDKDSNSKDNDITEPESQFTDLEEVTKLRKRLLLFSFRFYVLHLSYRNFQNF